MDGDGADGARLGDWVRVHYTGISDGERFDSSYERGEPLEFAIGARQVVAGFESAVIGMSPGESKTVDIPPSQAYGLYNPDMALECRLSTLPPGVERGTALVGQDGASGERLRFVVVAIRGDTATLDANHPLAGKTLTFEIELVEISERGDIGDAFAEWRT